MTIEEMKSAADQLGLLAAKACAALAEIEQLRSMPIPEADSIRLTDGATSCIVTGSLLRDVLRLGVAAAIEDRKADVVRLVGNAL